jgi:hypothetical protein
MPYSYQEERARLFTEDGSVTLTKIRDNVRHLLTVAGAVRSGEAMKGVSGDSWTMLAALDRMVEMGEIQELTGPSAYGQHRVFVRGMAPR